MKTKDEQCKKLGRPVGSTKASARRHRLTVLLNAEEMAAIRARAEAERESMSDYARRAALREDRP